MTKWLTQDPVGKWVMAVIGTIVMVGVVEPLKAMPIWAHVVGAATGVLLGLILQFGRKPLTVLAASVVGACAPWYLPLLRKIWFSVIGLLTSSYTVRGWVLLAIVVVSIAATFGFIALMVWLTSPIPSAEPAPPQWKKYRSDTVFGAMWRWDWSSSGSIIDLAAFCPHQHCQNQLVKIDYRFDYRSGRSYPELVCSNCGYGTRTPDEEANGYEVEQRVKLEIQRRLRTGEYLRALEGNQRTGA